MVKTLYLAGEHPSRLSASKETKIKYSPLSTCCFLHPSSALSRLPTVGGIRLPLQKQLCSGSMVPTCPAPISSSAPCSVGFFAFFLPFFPSFFFFFFFAALGLLCYMWAFPSCGKQEATLRFHVRASHLIAMASLVEHRLQEPRLQWL